MDEEEIARKVMAKIEAIKKGIPSPNLRITKDNICILNDHLRDCASEEIHQEYGDRIKKIIAKKVDKEARKDAEEFALKYLRGEYGEEQEEFFPHLEGLSDEKLKATKEYKKEFSDYVKCRNKENERNNYLDPIWDRVFNRLLPKKQERMLNEELADLGLEKKDVIFKTDKAELAEILNNAWKRGEIEFKPDPSEWYSLLRHYFTYYCTQNDGTHIFWDYIKQEIVRIKS